MSFKLAAIIPCYNHGNTADAVVVALQAKGLDVLIVNDGSNQPTTDTLRAIKASRGIHLLELEQNSGKGGAVMAGLRHLHQLGYSHAVQVDADGQHDLSKLSELIDSAKAHPQDVISGKPVYGDDVPKGRLYGRYLTHVSVWIETLSLQIQDSMCGFRVYPLAPVEQLLSRKQLGTRMDFDIEILVRLYWQGLSIRHVDTPVSYPEDGLSHFNAVSDNVKISWLHTRLICGMLPRIPKLLLRKFANED
ncbi:glycosyltransferase family 2 protein [Shewanella maritima]|uniref:glycosyltransferase family 2 protein n=1 Tax=Shewanella maritima TaxID=2520507 RepID=UPI0013EE9DD7|nr:glycosyltransferase family 2 protein [Shewanella maritima]